MLEMAFAPWELPHYPLTQHMLIKRIPESDTERTMLPDPEYLNLIAT